MSAELALPGLPLRAEKVTAGYGGDPVIRDITLSADPGEVVSLVGPNGSGKSTLLKSLAGVVHVSSGTVRVGDRDLTNFAPEEVARAAVGYVPQVDDIFSPLSVRENLEMGGYLLRRSQVAGPVVSSYWWEGDLERAEEWTLLLKLPAARYQELADFLSQRHSYDEPEIVATPIVAGSAAYLSWMEEVTQPQ